VIERFETGSSRVPFPKPKNGARKSGLPELQSFATGVERDKDAVKAGLTWPINNGMVEGQVTKLKLIKRTMYGRAGFALLHQRVLHAV
jgi:transposase